MVVDEGAGTDSDPVVAEAGGVSSLSTLATCEIDNGLVSLPNSPIYRQEEFWTPPLSLLRVLRTRRGPKKNKESSLGC